MKRPYFVAVALTLSLSGCAAMDAVLDYPMSFFDEETGEETTVPLGDLVADNSEGAASAVSTVLNGIHPRRGSRSRRLWICAAQKEASRCLLSER